MAMDSFQIIICDSDIKTVVRISESLKNAFTICGISVDIRICTCAQQCLIQLEKEPAGLVCLGIHMPHMDGIRLGEEIIMQNINRKPDILFVSDEIQWVFKAFSVQPIGFVRMALLEQEMQDVITNYVQMKLLKKIDRKGNRT